MSITHAYCAELKRVVSIDTARREYASPENKFERFTFFCQDANCCRSNGKRTRISGINYKHNIRTDGAIKYVTAHYREWDKHAANCTWVTRQVSNQKIDSTQQSEHTRQSRQKSTDLVTVFNLFQAAQDNAAISRTGSTSIDEISSQKDSRSARDENTSSKRRDSVTQTYRLEKLVETYIEAKETMPRGEFLAYELKIPGLGHVKISDFFRHLKYAALTTTNKVVFGGAVVIQKDSDTFQLRFYDTIENTLVYLYIGKDILEKCSYSDKKRIFEIINGQDKTSYINVYAIGHFERITHNKMPGISLVIQHVHHLFLELVSKKKP